MLDHGSSYGGSSGGFSSSSSSGSLKNKHITCAPSNSSNGDGGRPHLSAVTESSSDGTAVGVSGGSSRRLSCDWPRQQRPMEPHHIGKALQFACCGVWRKVCAVSLQTAVHLDGAAVSLWTKDTPNGHDRRLLMKLPGVNVSRFCPS